MSAGSPPRLVSIVVILVVSVLSLLAALPQDQVQWKDYQPILNATLPIERQIGIYVGYRYSHFEVPNEPEYAFVIGFRPQTNAPGLERTLSVDILMPGPTSVREQLTELHARDPERPLEEFRNKLKIQAFHLTEMDCPAIRPRFETFRKVQFTVFDSTLGIDRPFHEFRTSGPVGQTTMELFDPRHPLVAWALATKQDLDVCLSNGKQNSLRH